MWNRFSGSRSKYSTTPPARSICWVYSANDGFMRSTLSPGSRKANGKFLMISEDPAPMAMLRNESPWRRAMSFLTAVQSASG